MGWIEFFLNRARILSRMRKYAKLRGMIFGYIYTYGLLEKCFLYLCLKACTWWRTVLFKKSIYKLYEEINDTQRNGKSNPTYSYTKPGPLGLHYRLASTTTGITATHVWMDTAMSVTHSIPGARIVAYARIVQILEIPPPLSPHHKEANHQ